MKNFSVIFIFFFIIYSEKSHASEKRKTYLEVQAGISKLLNGEFNKIAIVNKNHGEFGGGLGFYVSEKFQIATNFAFHTNVKGKFKDLPKDNISYDINEFMIKLVYDFYDHDFGAFLYCGTGIGLSGIAYSDNLNQSYYDDHKKSTRFAYEIFLGSSIDVSDKISIQVKFAYKDLGKLSEVEYRIRPITVSLGLRVNF